MKKTFVVVLMAFFGLCACCIQGAFAKEKLTLNAPYDEMPSEIQNSDTFVEQLYVQEKEVSTKKFRKRKTQTPKFRFINTKNSPRAPMNKKEALKL